MIYTAYNDPYSEIAELTSRLSGNRHCTGCCCQISDDKTFVHTSRRGCSTMYLCSECANQLNWPRPLKPTIAENIKYYVDGLHRRQVL